MQKESTEGGSTELARRCSRGWVSTTLQLILAAVFVLGALWSASILLEPLRIIGITTVPPGVAYVDYDARS